MRAADRPSGAGGAAGSRPRAAGERRRPQAALRRRAASGGRPWPSAVLFALAAVAPAQLADAARQRGPRAAASAGGAGAAPPEGGPPPPDGPASGPLAAAWAPELLEGAAAAVVVKFQHVDFARLSRDPALRGRLELAAKGALEGELRGVAAAAAPRVDLRLFSAGRAAADRGGEEETAALARVFAATLDGGAAAQLQARLCSDGLLAEALTLAVANLDGIARASSGAVGAGNAITGSSWLCDPQPVVTVSFPNGLHGDVAAVHRAGEHMTDESSWERLRYFFMTGEFPWGQASGAAAKSGGGWEAQGGELRLQFADASAAAASGRGVEQPPEAAASPAPAPQPAGEAEACDPACGENGVCVDGACFCKHPYYGISCERFSFTGKRANLTFMVVSCVVASVLGVVLGYATHERWSAKGSEDGANHGKDAPSKGRETWTPEDPDE